MTTINITVQSLLNAAQFDPYTVDDTDTVGDLKNTIESSTSCNVSWFSLVFNNEELNTANTVDNPNPGGLIEGRPWVDTPPGP